MSQQSAAHVDTLDTEAGFSLVGQYCLACHTPYGSSDISIAPSLPEIRLAYLNASEGKKEFIERMSAFLKEPSVENSLISKAVDAYGLMPKMGLDDEEYRNISAYLHGVDMSSPDWFENKSIKQSAQQIADDSFMERGKTLAMSTKAVLGSNLLTAIKEKGTANALEFCNVKAIPLTDSMQQKLGVRIKRVSDRPRNPDNLASSAEQEYIRAMKENLDKGLDPQPKVVEQPDRAIGYYPIVTNQMCLQCHGNAGQEIRAGTLERIDKLYPNDLARGYGINELRGIWVIEMPKKQVLK